MLQERIDKALNLARRYGQIYGDWYKMWVIDQMVRALCGDEEGYEKWVSEYESAFDNEHYEFYKWDTGIAP